jgi:hypothetical protein
VCACVLFCVCVRVCVCVCVRARVPVFACQRLCKFVFGKFVLVGVMCKCTNACIKLCACGILFSACMCVCR